MVPKNFSSQFCTSSRRHMHIQRTIAPAWICTSRPNASPLSHPVVFSFPASFPWIRLRCIEIPVTALYLLQFLRSPQFPLPSLVWMMARFPYFIIWRCISAFFVRWPTIAVISSPTCYVYWPIADISLHKLKENVELHLEPFPDKYPRHSMALSRPWPKHSTYSFSVKFYSSGLSNSSFHFPRRWHIRTVFTVAPTTRHAFYWIGLPSFTPCSEASSWMTFSVTMTMQWPPNA